MAKGRKLWLYTNINLGKKITSRAGAFRIGKNSVVSTKIGKNTMFYEVFIVRLI